VLGVADSILCGGLPQAQSRIPKGLVRVRQSSRTKRSRCGSGYQLFLCPSISDLEPVTKSPLVPALDRNRGQGLAGTRPLPIHYQPEISSSGLTPASTTAPLTAHVFRAGVNHKLESYFNRANLEAQPGWRE
jgi:hypothetical protein